MNVDTIIRAASNVAKTQETRSRHALARTRWQTSGARPKYRRLNVLPLYRQDGRGVRTLPGRVCWHGTRDFLRALFFRVPDAKVRTAMATYNGAADFERTYRETYAVRSEYMGYMMPAPIDQPCACEEGGIS